MRIAILTSSRADFSLYRPLLLKLRKQRNWRVDIVAFGTHLSPRHGYTVKQIEKEGFKVSYRYKTMEPGDGPMDIARSMSRTVRELTRLWASQRFDWVFALGDRYEMCAAVLSTVPFGLRIAHLYGGETTLGAIDNKFRHMITIASSLHFTSTGRYRRKVVDILGGSRGVYNVGSLSMDNLSSLKLLTIGQFKEKYGINLARPTILFTFHPETEHYQKNGAYIKEIISALGLLARYQIVVTMPNADTAGKLIREKLGSFIERSPNAIGVENFGTLGYLSCMKHCAFMLGNSSSGFVEAAYFPKPVINLGERQAGRIRTRNIIDCPINRAAILRAAGRARRMKLTDMVSPYGHGNTADKIVEVLSRSIKQGMEFQHD